jgi:hypothetical protein
MAQPKAMISATMPSKHDEARMQGHGRCQTQKVARAHRDAAKSRANA